MIIVLPQNDPPSCFKTIVLHGIYYIKTILKKKHESLKSCNNNIIRIDVIYHVINCFKNHIFIILLHPTTSLLNLVKPNSYFIFTRLLASVLLRVGCKTYNYIKIYILCYFFIVYDKYLKLIFNK